MSYDKIAEMVQVQVQYRKRFLWVDGICRNWNF